jgi:hypothetical protein
MFLFEHRVHSGLLLLKRVTAMNRKVVEGGGTSRRLTLKALVLAPLAALGMEVLKPNKALADPNGTRPTMLLNLQVVSTGQNTMRISGRYVTFEGYGIAGMEVKIYAIGVAYFSVWGTAYTRNDGTFVWNGRKVPRGSAIQVEVQGNGAYSRPYPTFNNP